MAEYANKQVMLEQIAAHRTAYIEAKKKNVPVDQLPHPPDELIYTFYRMIDGIGSRYNFSGYPFLDEMKSEAIVSCYRKAHCFNPEKSQNPFGYFSKVIWQTFTDVIKEEKKSSYVKAKSIHMSQSYTSADDIEDFGEEIHEVNLANSYFDVDEYEKKNNLGKYRVVKERTKKAVTGPLDELFDYSEDEDDIQIDDEVAQTVDFEKLGEEVASS